MKKKKGPTAAAATMAWRRRNTLRNPCRRRRRRRIIRIIDHATNQLTRSLSPTNQPTAPNWATIYKYMQKKTKKKRREESRGRRSFRWDFLKNISDAIARRDHRFVAPHISNAFKRSSSASILPPLLHPERKLKSSRRRWQYGGNATHHQLAAAALNFKFLRVRSWWRTDGRNWGMDWWTNSMSSSCRRPPFHSTRLDLVLPFSLYGIEQLQLMTFETWRDEATSYTYYTTEINRRRNINFSHHQWRAAAGPRVVGCWSGLWYDHQQSIDRSIHLLKRGNEYSTYHNGSAQIAQANVLLINSLRKERNEWIKMVNEMEDERAHLSS